MSPRHQLALEGYAAAWVRMPTPDGKHVSDAVRVTVFGPNFPQRAIQPELLVGDHVAELVSISRDQRSLTGYFRRTPTDRTAIIVRYADSQEGTLPERFSQAMIRPLPSECAR